MMPWFSDFSFNFSSPVTVPLQEAHLNIPLNNIFLDPHFAFTEIDRRSLIIALINLFRSQPPSAILSLLPMKHENKKENLL